MLPNMEEEIINRIKRISLLEIVLPSVYVFKKKSLSLVCVTRCNLLNFIVFIVFYSIL